MLAAFVLFACVFVARLFVDRGVAGELEHAAGRAEGAIRRADIDGGLIVDRRRHLAGDEPLPDQAIDLELRRLQELGDALRRTAHFGRPDRFVRVLRALGHLVLAAAVILGAEAIDDVLARHHLRGLRQARRIGAHVGDQADRAFAHVDAFIQTLRDLHRLAHAHLQAARCLLLQRAGRERAARIIAPFAAFDRVDEEAFAAQPLGERVGVFFARDIDRFVADRGQHIGGQVVLRSGDRYQVGVEGVVRIVVSVRPQARAHRPVTMPHERFDLALAVDDQLDRHRLHASGGQAAAYFAPQQWRDLVAYQTIEDPARLLRVDPVHVDFARIFERGLGGAFGDLVQFDALRMVELEQLGEVPGDGFAFAVGVGGQIDVVRLFGGRAQLFDDVALTFDGDV